MRNENETQLMHWLRIELGCSADNNNPIMTNKSYELFEWLFCQILIWTWLLCHNLQLIWESFVEFVQWLCPAQTPCIYDCLSACEGYS